MVEAGILPAVFVVDHDPNSLAVLLSDLSRRFGNDFTLRGETSPERAVVTLHEMAAVHAPVALVLVDDADSAFLALAHELYPRAKRVLLIDRDYSSRSPAVQAMALGQVDYHIVRPWADEEAMYGAMSDYLSSWTSEQEPNFELFRIVAADGDSRVVQLRDVMTRFSMPFGFYAVESEGRTAAAGRSRARREPSTGRDSLRRPGDHRPDLVRPRPCHRRQRQERRGDLPGRDRWRRAGGFDGSRLRRVGGARHRVARTSDLGRAGRHEPADQELPRISARHQRWRAHGANLRAGVADGSAHRLRAASRRARTAW